MKCRRCRAEIEPGEEREFKGETYCERCYMEILRPKNACGCGCCGPANPNGR